MGERRDRSAGGGRGDAKAVGRHARRGGRSAWGSGGWMSSTMVSWCYSSFMKGEKDIAGSDRCTGSIDMI